ncbi:MAG: bifunctional metallophosphatase/5'-nucleotidase [Elusimicrobia bacterium]|nr:bifunctional metallophosphatase/5'-nucleotidase [Elusimicrobiota bacterium]
MRRMALCLLLLLAALPVGAQKLRLNVYHTNDIHGWILSRPDPQTGVLVGGAAALANVIKADKGPKLLVDAGDWFQGAPEGSLTRGRALADMFNLLRYDAVAIGNHEFDFGQANLKELIARIRAPALAANIYRERGGRPPFARPWVIKEVDGIKVGIFGLISSNMPRLTFPENYQGLVFRREIDEARDAVQALRKAGATVIIALTHVGFEDPQRGSFEGDQSLAHHVEGIDLIVGGHSHTFLKSPLRDASHGTLIVQAGTGLTVVGRATLEIERKTGKVYYATGTLVELSVDRFGEDEGALKALRVYQREADKILDVVVATAAAALVRDRDAESPLGTWMTDCSRRWAGVDVALQNGGGIRADMPAGPVTLRHLFSIMPFDNRVVKLSMSGKLLLEALDHGVGRNKGMTQVSGASFVYDRDAPSGSRVKDVRVGLSVLQPEAVYSVAAADFMVKGGDGFSALGQAEKKEFTGILVRDVLKWCAQKEGLIRPPALGRIKPKNGRI